MTPTLAANLTHWFTARWQRGPKVHIAPTARDLPVPAPDDVRGLYWRGDVHLVAAQPLDSMAQTLAHEAVGHHGLRQLMGAEWPHFMRQISDGLRAGDPGLQQIRSHIQSSYVDDAGHYQLSARQEADETAAYVAETLVCLRTGTIRPDNRLAKAALAIKGRLLREGLCLDRHVTRAELEGTLFLAAKHLEGWPWLILRQRIDRLRATCGNIGGMPKFDLRKPPMSLAESEKLLRGHAQQEKDKQERGALWDISVALFGIVLFFGGIFIFFYSFFGR
jgi:hypothetical protein